MTVTATITETVIAPAVTETTVAAAVTESPVTAAVSETTVTASVGSTPVSAAVTNSSIAAAVTSTPITVSVSALDPNSHVALTIGTPANGLSVAGQVLSIALASASVAGALSSANWSTFNSKQDALTADVDYLTPGTAASTYQPIGAYLTAETDPVFLASQAANITSQNITDLGNLSGTNTGDVTLGAPANGLSLLGQVLSLALASSGVTGALSGTDWDTFSAKQAALTFPLAANLGGTGVANLAGSTLTLGAATSITGGGTVALGGFTLTVPATGTAALLATANVFTAAQTITPATDVVGLTINKSTTADAWQIKSGATVLAGVTNAGRFYANLGTTAENLFVGPLAGNPAATATYATGIGAYALASLTNGTQNTAIGRAALYSCTTGQYNAAIGFNALFACVNGSGNMAMGAQALRLGTGTSFTNNMAMGSSALYSCIGSGNVGIGVNAGYYTTLQNYCIFIGNNAGARQTASSVLVLDAVAAIRASAAVEISSAIIYGVMAETPASQTLRLNAVTSIVQETAATNTIVNVGILRAESTGTPAAGFGVAQLFVLETATTGTNQNAGLISTSWIDATNATRKAKMSLSAYDTAARLGIEIEASGTAAKLGFFGVTTVVQQANNTAIDTLLSNLGLRASGGEAFFDTRLMLPMGEISYFDMTGTAVVIATQSDGSTNMVKAAPATTFSNDKEFDNGGADDGRLRYIGATTRTFHVACTISIAPASANDTFVFGVAKTGIVLAESKVLIQATTASGIRSTAMHVMVSLATNDYLELYVGNTTDADDCTVHSLNIFAMGM
jgi:hypothetical protein